MASTILEPIADALAVIVEALPSITGDPIRADRWVQVPMSRPPCAVIELPKIGRTRPEEAESQLGARDWDLEYPVNFHFALRVADETQRRLAQVIEEFINAVDADPGLGGLVLEAKVTDADIVYDETDSANPLIVYETTVAVLKLV